ncbi:MAG: aminotransferase class V-fold PLP-dependent enzyme [Anaerolineae bacterium]|nr:aminotransferase class V-fold PLP-dependent enzyme [Anaerolineae bacterium]
MDVYAELGIVPLINAAGTLTRLSGSLMPPEVVEAMAAAARSFVDMDELHLAAGRRIAELIGVEAAHVCNGAAAGIALMAAACMAGSDRAKIAQLPDTTGMRHHFVIQRAHRNPFDQALRQAGGVFVEVGPGAAELDDALGNHVAAVYYTLSWFCFGEALPLPDAARIAHDSGVPLILDAAAQVPPVTNLSQFVELGADLVTFSGGKAIRGPQGSGLILGRADLVEACRLNDNPHMGIGRPMKASKEDIVGLVKAVELYVTKDHAQEAEVWERRVNYVVNALSDLDHVKVARRTPYGIGQQVPLAAISWNVEAIGLNYAEAARQLLEGSPRIAVRVVTPDNYAFAGFTQGEIRVYADNLQDGEEVVVARRLREVLTRRAQGT